MCEIITQYDSYEIRKTELCGTKQTFVVRYDREKEIYYCLETSTLFGLESDEFYQVPVLDEMRYIQKYRKTISTMFDTDNSIKLSFEDFKRLGGTTYDLVELELHIDRKGLREYYS